MAFQRRVVLVIGMLLAIGGQAQAFMSDLGIETSLLEPAGWNVGDAGSTHQVWDNKAAAMLNVPDRTYNTAGATLTAPTHSVKYPGFRSSTGNYYSFGGGEFGGDFGATADIYNHGGPATGMGTHVIVQVGATLNPEAVSFPGHGTGVYLNSMKLTDLSGSALAGGANGDKLSVAEISYYEEVLTSFGNVEYQELIFEFWLPGYTGNFRVDWDAKVHSTLDTLRVDSMMAAEAAGGGSPFPLSLVGAGSNGDFNLDMAVDAADYAVWRKSPAAYGDAAGYAAWRSNFGKTYGSGAGALESTSVPEPATALLVALAMGCAIGRRRR